MADVVRTEPARLLRRSQQSRARTLKRALGWSVFYAALSAGAIAMVLPLIWMVSGSLKEPDQIFAIPVQWVPDPARWQNYSEALSRAPVGRYFFYRIVIGMCWTLSGLFVRSLARFRSA